MLTMGRLGTLAGLEPKTLRYYDRVGLVRPTGRTAAGYRLYGEDTINRLHFIRRSKALGMSLADIRRTRWTRSPLPRGRSRGVLLALFLPLAGDPAHPGSLCRARKDC